MHIFFISIVMAGILVGSFYLNFFFKRMFTFFSAKKTKLFNVLFLLTIAALLVAVLFNALGTPTAVFGFLLVFCLLFDLIGILYRKWFFDKKIVKYLYFGGIPAFLMTAIVTILGIFNGFHVVMTEYDLNIDKVIPQNGLNIVFIADIHMGVSITADNLAGYCREIESLNPDIVLLGGDIFDERTTTDEVILASKELGGISSTYGTYFVYGNHDGDAHVVSGGEPTDVAFIHETLAENDVIILEDETVLIDDLFYLVGRTDSNVHAQQASAQHLMEGLDKEKPIIVLEHKPIDVENMANWGADLYLSGHTHGGQIPPMGFFESFMYDKVYGLEKVGDCTMIVTSGMGTWNTPIRIGSVSEYVFIQLSQSAV